jgi:hypothetical protein
MICSARCKIEIFLIDKLVCIAWETWCSFTHKIQVVADSIKIEVKTVK